MATYLFANNASTTLAGGISAAATSANLAASSGAEFPNPAAGQIFAMTFIDAATQLENEIVYVTARSGDTVTIMRGQEGTTAQSWLAGDIAANYWTAGSAAFMVQEAQAQQQSWNYANDTGPSGTDYRITLTPSPTVLSQLLGAPIRIKSAHANTGSSTLTISGVAATIIVNTDGTNLTAGQIPSGAIFTVVFDGTHYQLVSPTAFELLGRSNVWTGPSNRFIGPVEFDGNVSIANNTLIYGKDTAGAVRPMMIYDAANFVDIMLGTGAGQSSGPLLRILSSDLTAEIAHFDGTGSLTLQGMLTALGVGGIASGGPVNATGNVVANGGRLRASAGTIGAGTDGNVAPILADFLCLLTGAGYLKIPAQATNGSVIQLILQWGTMTVPIQASQGGPTGYAYNLRFPNSFLGITGSCGALTPVVTGMFGIDGNVADPGGSFVATIVSQTSIGQSLGCHYIAIGW